MTVKHGVTGNFKHNFGYSPSPKGTDSLTCPFSSRAPHASWWCPVTYSLQLLPLYKARWGGFLWFALAIRFVTGCSLPPAERTHQGISLQTNKFLHPIERNPATSWYASNGWFLQVGAGVLVALLHFPLGKIFAAPIRVPTPQILNLKWCVRMAERNTLFIWGTRIIVYTDPQEKMAYILQCRCIHHIL